VDCAHAIRLRRPDLPLDTAHARNYYRRIERNTCTMTTAPQKQPCQDCISLAIGTYLPVLVIWIAHQLVLMGKLSIVFVHNPVPTPRAVGFTALSGRILSGYKAVQQHHRLTVPYYRACVLHQHNIRPCSISRKIYLLSSMPRDIIQVPGTQHPRHEQLHKFTCYQNTRKSIFDHITASKCYSH
jgi:hypothetical protein